MQRLRALAGVTIALGVLAASWKAVTPEAPDEPDDRGEGPEPSGDGGDGAGPDNALLRRLEDLAVELKGLGGDQERIEGLLQQARQRDESELSEIRSELHDIRARLEEQPGEPAEPEEPEPADFENDDPTEPQTE